MLVLLQLIFDEITKTDTDPKGRFVSFKITSSNNRVLSIFAPSGHSIREQLTWGHFFGGEKTYMENKTQGNENKILGDFICTMDKMGEDVATKTQKLLIKLCPVKTHHR